jgi:hypothetical protein
MIADGLRPSKDVFWEKRRYNLVSHIVRFVARLGPSFAGGSPGRLAFKNFSVPLYETCAHVSHLK